MDYSRLRELLQPLISDLKDAGQGWKLPEICSELALRPPPEEGSKRERMEASLRSTVDRDLPEVARQLLARHPPSASLRNTIQDVLWSDTASVPLPKRCRREVARRLNIEDLFLDAGKFDDLLERLWVLDSDTDWAAAFASRPSGLREEIQQHVHRNPDDWTPEALFAQLGVYEASNARFGFFLEGLASADVRPDEAAQRNFVSRVNEVLRGYGAELRETDTDGGYPVFSLVPLHASAKGRPKNLIFASPKKPDLRFRDALDNEIEIVTNADQVLVYDLPIGKNGLRWCDLQQWWSNTKGIADADHAKRTLYNRLKASLPSNSPPQLLLFEAFYSAFGSAVPKLPALLPEVWLHWDPVAANARGRDALLRLRMDFLLLLPQGVRIVIEVDGKHHYADRAGRADVHRYADLVRGDRELKLVGYEVFRFGGAELQAPSAKEVVRTFFESVFKRYGVLPE